MQKDSKTTPRVVRIEPCRGEYVLMDGGDYPEHIRYSEDNWMTLMGESWESEYRNDELESAYQKFKRENP